MAAEMSRRADPPVRRCADRTPSDRDWRA